MIDPTKINCGLESAASALAWAAGGWMVLAKSEGSWKSYFLDGENGVVRRESDAREIYAITIRATLCEAARLIRILPESSFTMARKS